MAPTPNPTPNLTSTRPSRTLLLHENFPAPTIPTSNPKRGLPPMSRMHHTLLLFAATLLPVAAHADTLDTITFDFPAYTSSSPTISFPALQFAISVPASPTLLPTNNICSTGCFSFVADINGNPNVFDVTPDSISYAPGTATNVPNNPLGYVDLNTPLLFSGSTTSPTFVVGTYDATFAFAHPEPGITSPGTITIAGADTTSPVPEPTTLTLLATGSLGLLTTVRRRLTR